MKPIFVSIKPSTTYFNLGDNASSPANYFPWDVHTACFTAVPDNGNPLVLGGGGLLMPGVTDWLERQLDKRKVAIWGAGLNYGDDIPPELIRVLNRCVLVGMRDREFTMRTKVGTYVPCASCLHPEFNRAQHITPDRRAVVYRHGWSTPFLDELPCLTNTDRNLTLPDVLNFLASAEVVVTNSYHGAYWAMLLGRAVVLWQVGVMRFFTGLPSVPPIAYTEEQARRLLDPYATVGGGNPDFLAIATALNRRFSLRVMERFKISLK